MNIKSDAERIMNVVIYGNPEGVPTFKGKCSTMHDDFLKTVFAYKGERNVLPRHSNVSESPLSEIERDNVEATRYKDE